MVGLLSYEKFITFLASEINSRMRGMKYSTVVLILAIAFVDKVIGQIPAIGRCPDLPVVKNFNLNKVR